MIILRNQDLAKRTTFHVGGISELLYVPESEQELIDIARQEYERHSKLYLLGGGSNLLVNDKKVFSSVIDTSKACKEFQYIDNGIFYVGASNRIQNIIKRINSYSYGGIEELYCLPAMFGGIICMNAGIGGKNNSKFTISDFIISVRAYNAETGVVEEVPKAECQFGHRKSLFQSGHYVILGATLKMEEQDQTVSEERIKNRIKFVKENQNHGKGCFGSCFAVFNNKIMRLTAIMIKAMRGGYYKTRTTQTGLSIWAMARITMQ